MAYIFEFKTHTIRVQEQRHGVDIPGHRCRIVAASKFFLDSEEHHHHDDVIMMTFSVASGNTLGVTTHFPGFPLRVVDNVDKCAFANDRLTSIESPTKPTRDSHNNAISISPVTLRGSGNTGVLLWVNAKLSHGEDQAIGIFCKVQQEGDEEREGEEIYFGYYDIRLYRENKNSSNSTTSIVHNAGHNISPEPESASSQVHNNTLWHTTQYGDLNNTRHVISPETGQKLLRLLTDMDIKCAIQTDLLKTSTGDLQKSMNLCCERIQLIDEKLSNMPNANRDYQLQEESSRIRQSENLENAMKRVQDTIIDSIKAMKTSIVASEAAIKATSFQNATSLKNAVDTINMHVCQLFVEQKKSFATEHLTIRKFDTQYDV